MLWLVGVVFGLCIKDVFKVDVLMLLEVFLISVMGKGKCCLFVVDEV